MVTPLGWGTPLRGVGLRVTTLVLSVSPLKQGVHTHTEFQQSQNSSKPSSTNPEPLNLNL